MLKSSTIVLATVGGIVFAGLLIGFVWFYKKMCKNVSNRNSDTGSSDPSALVEWNRGGPSLDSAVPSGGIPGARQFAMEELEQATKQFDESNLIGYGSFGPVYKGLLRDGTVVAIKRRPGSPRLEFIEEVASLSEIRHRNLVSLLGYCQERGTQILVFEYLPNGNMCNHLYGSASDPSTKLEFKQRLSIALTAGKGLSHLHSLKPPLLHNNFKTANVLVDENFIAKVSDAGISKLLEKIEEAGPSHSPGIGAFRDPELGPLGLASEKSDVYGFGVFLLELVTGREAVDTNSFESNERLFQWVDSQLNLNEFVDARLVGRFTLEGMRDMIRLILNCMSFPAKRRPKMEAIVDELERIQEKEMALTTVMGEGTAKIIPGSELFTS